MKKLELDTVNKKLKDLEEQRLKIIEEELPHGRFPDPFDYYDNDGNPTYREDVHAETEVISYMADDGKIDYKIVCKCCDFSRDLRIFAAQDRKITKAFWMLYQSGKLNFRHFVKEDAFYMSLIKNDKN